MRCSVLRKDSKLEGQVEPGPMAIKTLSPRIAILGAGPCGLSLLNILSRHNVAATLYERDAEFASRAHLGGMLDLHLETGQAAIQAAGLADAFLKHARFDAEESILTDKMGVALAHHIPPVTGGTRPEIDRLMLRRILVDGAPEGSIKWGYTFVSATPVEGTAQWRIVFANGHSDVVDLLIGADGARSRVRPLVSDAPIEYSGLTGAEVSFGPAIAAAHPQLMARIGEGSLYAMEDFVFLSVQKNGDGRVRSYAFFAAEDPDVLVEPIKTNPATALALILSRYEGWAPWLRQLLELADLDAIYPRPLYQLPVGHSWKHRRGVTLAGDAMNLMTPFAGQGVNVAMHAALNLANAIVAAVRGEVELDSAVAKYEQEMFHIAELEAAKTEANVKCLTRKGGALELLTSLQDLFNH